MINEQLSTQHSVFTCLSEPILLLCLLKYQQFFCVLLEIYYVILLLI